MPPPDRAHSSCQRNVHRPRRAGTRNDGFTLVELMIVVAIIAILAGIALPLFARYQARAAENACLAETKNYVGLSLAAQLGGDVPLPAPLKACASAEDFPGTNSTIAGTPKAPGVHRTICNVASANCSLEP